MTTTVTIIWKWIKNTHGRTHGRTDARTHRGRGYCSFIWHWRRRRHHGTNP
jgi:hypothetical protein